GVHARVSHEVVDDAQIGPAAKVVTVDRPGRSVGLFERPSERRAAGTAHRYQRAVDVEEEEAHPTEGPGGGAGSPPPERHRARCRSRSRWSSGPARSRASLPRTHGRSRSPATRTTARP